MIKIQCLLEKLLIICAASLLLVSCSQIVSHKKNHSRHEVNDKIDQEDVVDNQQNEDHSEWRDPFLDVNEVSSSDIVFIDESDDRKHSSNQSSAPPLTVHYTNSGGSGLVYGQCTATLIEQYTDVFSRKDIDRPGAKIIFAGDLLSLYLFLISFNDYKSFGLEQHILLTETRNFKAYSVEWNQYFLKKIIDLYQESNELTPKKISEKELDILNRLSVLFIDQKNYFSQQHFFKTIKKQEQGNHFKLEGEGRAYFLKWWSYLVVLKNILEKNESENITNLYEITPFDNRKILAKESKGFLCGTYLADPLVKGQDDHLLGLFQRYFSTHRRLIDQMQTTLYFKSPSVLIDYPDAKYLKNFQNISSENYHIMKNNLAGSGETREYFYKTAPTAIAKNEQFKIYLKRKE